MPDNPTQLLKDMACECIETQGITSTTIVGDSATTCKIAPGKIVCLRCRALAAVEEMEREHGELILRLHGALPATWAYTDTVTTVDLAIAEISTLRVELTTERQAREKAEADAVLLKACNETHAVVMGRYWDILAPDYEGEMEFGGMLRQLVQRAETAEERLAAAVGALQLTHDAFLSAQGAYRDNLWTTGAGVYLKPAFDAIVLALAGGKEEL